MPFFYTRLCITSIIRICLGLFAPPEEKKLKLFLIIRVHSQRECTLGKVARTFIARMGGEPGYEASSCASTKYYIAFEMKGTKVKTLGTVACARVHGIAS